MEKQRNKFRVFFDKKTIGYGRAERENYKNLLASQLFVSKNVINNWIAGVTTPTILQQIAINEIIGKIY